MSSTWDDETSKQASLRRERDRHLLAGNHDKAAQADKAIQESRERQTQYVQEQGWADSAPSSGSGLCLLVVLLVLTLPAVIAAGALFA